MNGKEFIDRLSDKYAKDINNIDIEDMKRLLKNQYKSDDFQPLYDFITTNYNYKTFPPLSLVVSFLNENSGSSAQKQDKYQDIINHNNAVVAKWMSWSLPKIMSVIDMIREVPEMNDSHKLFWLIFGEISNEYLHMKEKGYNMEGIKDHLNHVLGCIKNDKPFDSIIEKEKTPNLNVFENDKLLNKEKRT